MNVIYNGVTYEQGDIIKYRGGIYYIDRIVESKAGMVIQAAAIIGGSPTTIYETHFNWLQMMGKMSVGHGE